MPMDRDRETLIFMLGEKGLSERTERMLANARKALARAVGRDELGIDALCVLAALAQEPDGQDGEALRTGPRRRRSE
jgi:hypothetical protein